MWHMAPNKDEAQKASIELCENLYMYDCLRCDRSTAAHGLEVRVPFLSNTFIHNANMIDPALKLPQEGLEKHLLRHAFKGDLPDEILFRTKAAFSDAVGTLWVDQMKEYTNSIISDTEFEQERTKYTHCTPRTKEELFYRQIFEKHFPKQGHIIKDFWKIKWNDLNDPSARFLPCYKS
jgi:asparagine synthase (glutamine-hydrolysing)